MAVIQYYATGRRKTSTARVFLRPGTGKIAVNSRSFESFFPTEVLRTQVRTPLLLTETADKFDVLATVAGGGVSGQAGAVRLGIDHVPAPLDRACVHQKRSHGQRLSRMDSNDGKPKSYGS